MRRTSRPLPATRSLPSAPSRPLVAPTSPTAASGRFLVREHLATWPYWELLLETGGVLASWTLPKGPSLDPLVKCLAVAGADRPIAELARSGMMADEEYGAGEVLAWDSGTFVIDDGADPGLARTIGRLSFTLRGSFLHGGFTLVRMGGRYGGRNWLLTKASDAQAVPGWTMFQIDPSVSGVRPASTA